MEMKMQRRKLGVTELKDQVWCKTAISLIMALVGIVELLILSMFLH
ncbi:MAG: hypothetical protein LUD07_10620 [Clostridiales bacterium]|nr:hypothetical protein [Clostridiales bacterium]